MQTQFSSESSWKMKLINSLGLKKFLTQKLVFRPPDLNYSFDMKDGNMVFGVIKDGKKYRPKYEKLNVIFDPYVIIEYCWDIIVSEVPLLHITFNYSISEYISREKEPNRKLIIFSHGNASSLGDTYSFAAKIANNFNCDVITYDYSGYGLTLDSLKPSEENFSRDLLNVLAFAVHRLEYKTKQIILWGFSLGTAPTIQVASRVQVDAVILIAPMASIGCVVEGKVNNQQDQDIFNSSIFIDKIRSKILIIHGTEDKVIDIQNSYILRQSFIEKNPGRKKEISFKQVQGAGHNDLGEYIENAFSDVAQQIRKFLCKKYSHDEQANNQIDSNNQIDLEEVYRELVVVDKLGQGQDIKIKQDNMPARDISMSFTGQSKLQKYTNMLSEQSKQQFSDGDYQDGGISCFCNKRRV